MLRPSARIRNQKGFMRSFFKLLPEHKNLPLQLGEDAGGLFLRVLMPGIAKERISLELQGQNLTICGQVTTERCFYLRQERPSGLFCRTLRLGALADNLDADSATADLKNGVLTVRLPKKPGQERAGKRRVPLQPACK